VTNNDTTVNEAEVAGKLGGYFGVMGSDPRIRQLLAKIFPEVKMAASGDPSGWQSAFLNVMSKYEGLAKELGLGVSQIQRDLETLRTSNRSAWMVCATMRRSMAVVAARNVTAVVRAAVQCHPPLMRAKHRLQ
jgi:hypothetical protein